MQLVSSDFIDMEEIPEKFTCKGEGISPALIWSDIPQEARSFALQLTDPDAPGGDFVHWAIINIPTATTSIEQGKTPEGNQLPNSSGNINYVPPCPPSGAHRYIFTIYALDIDHITPEGISDFLEGIRPHIIDQTTLTGIFGR